MNHRVSASKADAFTAWRRLYIDNPLYCLQIAYTAKCFPRKFFVSIGNLSFNRGLLDASPLRLSHHHQSATCYSAFHCSPVVFSDAFVILSEPPRQGHQIIRIYAAGTGAADETRTHNLRITKPLLYQLGYDGVWRWTEVSNPMASRPPTVFKTGAGAVRHRPAYFYAVLSGIFPEAGESNPSHREHRLSMLSPRCCPDWLLTVSSFSVFHSVILVCRERGPHLTSFGCLNLRRSNRRSSWQIRGSHPSPFPRRSFAHLPYSLSGEDLPQRYDSPVFYPHRCK